MEGGCHCTGERGGRRGERGTQRASQRPEVEDPEACASRRRRAQLALRLGSARAGGGDVGEIPQPLPDYFTSPKWCRNSRPGDVFSLPHLRYAPPLHSPPPEDITFIFQYVVYETPGHSSESWVNTEEMFLGVRKGGVGCVRTGETEEWVQRRNYIVNS